MVVVARILLISKVSWNKTRLVRDLSLLVTSSSSSSVTVTPSPSPVAYFSNNNNNNDYYYYSLRENSSKNIIYWRVSRYCPEDPMGKSPCPNDQPTKSMDPMSNRDKRREREGICHPKITDVSLINLQQINNHRGSSGYSERRTQQQK